jgi:hypothetical protein
MGTLAAAGVGLASLGPAQVLGGAAGAGVRRLIEFGVVLVVGLLGLAGHDGLGAAVADQFAALKRGAAAEDAAVAGGALAEHVGGGEVVGEAAALFLGGGVEQPHQQEERHHGGDEVGIGHLPGAAMVAALDNLLAPDHHGAPLAALVACHRCCLRAASGATGALCRGFA